MDLNDDLGDVDRAARRADLSPGVEDRTPRCPRPNKPEPFLGRAEAFP
jgi:hypothetical protein